MDNDKIKILDVRMPKEQQWKLEPHLRTKKYQANIEFPDGKVRYLYGDDPVKMELYAKSINATILKTVKL